MTRKPYGIKSLLMESWAMGFSAKITAELLESMFGMYMHTVVIHDYWERLNMEHIKYMEIHHPYQW